MNPQIAAIILENVKKNHQRVKPFLVQVVCVIPKEMFTSGKLSQLQAPDPSLVQGWNFVF